MLSCTSAPLAYEKLRILDCSLWKRKNYATFYVIEMLSFVSCDAITKAIVGFPSRNGKKHMLLLLTNYV